MIGVPLIACSDVRAAGAGQGLPAARRRPDDLDEPSAGLDAEAEHEVHRQLARLRAGRTSVVVSHRLGAIRDADDIVVLVTGLVAGLGVIVLGLAWLRHAYVVVTVEGESMLPTYRPGERVLGDNPRRSFDSRRTGYLTADRLLGVVLRKVEQGRTRRPHAETPPVGRLPAGRGRARRSVRRPVRRRARRGRTGRPSRWAASSCPGLPAGQRSMGTAG
ncbi:hypothetical protein ABT158_30925 [Nonomuraea sp. NPDC001636]|uniref:hypothetical protein n=1 Tax=Nonomuraea sp. NPDC001636 TaxID=3154391 RepID=UPI00332A40D9